MFVYMCVFVYLYVDFLTGCASSGKSEHHTIYFTTITHCITHYITHYITLIDHPYQTPPILNPLNLTII